MSKVEAVKDGYKVNAQFISEEDARTLFSLVQDRMNKEAILECIRESYGDQIAASVPDNLLTKMADEFQDKKDDVFMDAYSSGWKEPVNEIIEDYEPLLQNDGKEIG